MAPTKFSAPTDIPGRGAMQEYQVPTSKGKAGYPSRRSFGRVSPSLVSSFTNSFKMAMSPNTPNTWLTLSSPVAGFSLSFSPLGQLSVGISPSAQALLDKAGTPNLFESMDIDVRNWKAPEVGGSFAAIAEPPPGTIIEEKPVAEAREATAAVDDPFSASWLNQHGVFFGEEDIHTQPDLTSLEHELNRIAAVEQCDTPDPVEHAEQDIFVMSDIVPEPLNHGTNDNNTTSTDAMWNPITEDFSSASQAVKNNLTQRSPMNSPTRYFDYLANDANPGANSCLTGATLDGLYPPQPTSIHEDNHADRMGVTTKTSHQAAKTLPAGSSSRDVHNAMERERRINLRKCFDNLRMALPSLCDAKAPSLQILQEAASYITALKEQEAELEAEKQRMLDENRKLATGGVVAP